MKSISISRTAYLLLIIFAVFSCNEKEEFETEKLSDYLPTITGKYITYRLDSMVFTGFGRTTEFHKYQVKHVIDSQFTDLAGRKYYRVYRFIRDSAGVQPWQPMNDNTYTITTLMDQVEIDEDNLKVIKLHLPFKNGTDWKGNSYLPLNPYAAYSFSNDDNMADWEFYFDGAASSFSYQGNNYSNVQTVEQADEVINVPITDPNAYAAKTRAVERYSKNIGLVYRELEMWEYQPNPGGSGGPYKTGFGIKMWMIEHN